MRIFLIAFLILHSTISYAQTIASDKTNGFVFPDSTWEYVKDPSTQAELTEQSTQTALPGLPQGGRVKATTDTPVGTSSPCL